MFPGGFGNFGGGVGPAAGGNGSFTGTFTGTFTPSLQGNEPKRAKDAGEDNKPVKKKPFKPKAMENTDESKMGKEEKEEKEKAQKNEGDPWSLVLLKQGKPFTKREFDEAMEAFFGPDLDGNEVQEALEGEYDRQQLVDLGPDLFLFNPQHPQNQKDAALSSSVILAGINKAMGDPIRTTKI